MRVRAARVLVCAAAALANGVVAASQQVAQLEPGAIGPVFTVAAVGRVSSLNLRADDGAVVLSWSDADGARDARVSADRGRTWLQASPEMAGRVPLDGGWTVVPKASDKREHASSATTLIWVRPDSSGNILTIWRGASPARLVFHRDPLAGGGARAIGTAHVPWTLTTTAAADSPVAALGLNGGALAAWVSTDARGAAIRVREIAYDTSCGFASSSAAPFGADVASPR